MNDNESNETESTERLDFIRRIVEEDNASSKWGGRVATRFPPEPNGYLHIGHAKSICLNFGIAQEYGGTCNLRYDDTNPEKEEEEYVKSIEGDVRWLGFKPASVIWASDYFQQMYDWGVELIKKGLAYVDDLTAEQIREHRGTLTSPGRDSPFRSRSVEENLDLFDRMRKGEFPDGSKVVRAKIDMASPNLNLRDPVMYRILHEEHHNTGRKWCIYPMYDWAHGFEDSLEKITHSICTLEFENHRPLYDWFIDAVNKDRPKDQQIWHPQQIEFARLNLTYTMLSKRKLLQLVNEKIVSGCVAGCQGSNTTEYRGARYGMARLRECVGERQYVERAFIQDCASRGSIAGGDLMTEYKLHIRTCDGARWLRTGACIDLCVGASRNYDRSVIFNLACCVPVCGIRRHRQLSEFIRGSSSRAS